MRFFSTSSHLPPARIISTRDIGLAAYAMLRGATLQGWTQNNDGFLTFTLTARGMQGIIIEWYDNKCMWFSPRIFMKHRAYLKNIHRRMKENGDYRDAALKSDGERQQHLYSTRVAKEE